MMYLKIYGMVGTSLDHDVIVRKHNSSNNIVVIDL